MKTKILIAALGVFLLFFSAMCNNDDQLADKRENITGSWHCTLDDGNDQQDYTVDITLGSGENDLILKNFIANSSNATGTMSGLTISVPEQQVGNSVVSASGTIASDYQTINWDITIDGTAYTAQYVPGGVTKLLEQ